jgi:hypothetical protein
MAAIRSAVGVGIGPPKVLVAPKPTSSVRMRSTLGAPSGAAGSAGKSFTESDGLKPVVPSKGGSGIGRTSRSAASAETAPPNPKDRTATKTPLFTVAFIAMVIAFSLSLLRLVRIKQVGPGSDPSLREQELELEAHAPLGAELRVLDVVEALQLSVHHRASPPSPATGSRSRR